MLIRNVVHIAFISLIICVNVNAKPQYNSPDNNEEKALPPSHHPIKVYGEANAAKAEESLWISTVSNDNNPTTTEAPATIVDSQVNHTNNDNENKNSENKSVYDAAIENAGNASNASTNLQIAENNNSDITNNTINNNSSIKPYQESIEEKQNSTDAPSLTTERIDSSKSVNASESSDKVITPENGYGDNLNNTSSVGNIENGNQEQSIPSYNAETPSHEEEILTNSTTSASLNVSSTIVSETSYFVETTTPIIIIESTPVSSNDNSAGYQDITTSTADNNTSTSLHSTPEAAQTISVEETTISSNVSTTTSLPADIPKNHQKYWSFHGPITDVKESSTTLSNEGEQATNGYDNIANTSSTVQNVDSNANTENLNKEISEVSNYEATLPANKQTLPTEATLTTTQSTENLVTENSTTSVPSATTRYDIETLENATTSDLPPSNQTLATSSYDSSNTVVASGNELSGNSITVESTQGTTLAPEETTIQPQTSVTSVTSATIQNNEYTQPAEQLSTSSITNEYNSNNTITIPDTENITSTDSPTTTLTQSNYDNQLQVNASQPTEELQTTSWTTNALVAESVTEQPKPSWEIEQGNSTDTNVTSTVIFKIPTEKNDHFLSDISPSFIETNSALKQDNSRVVEPSGYGVYEPFESNGYDGIPSVSNNSVAIDSQQHDIAATIDDSKTFISKLSVKEVDSSTHRKWKPFHMDCSEEVDDHGPVLCAEWANAGLCTKHRATMFLFCRRTCLCTGPTDESNIDDNQSSKIESSTSETTPPHMSLEMETSPQIVTTTTMPLEAVTSNSNKLATEEERNTELARKMRRRHRKLLRLKRSLS